MGAIVIGVIVSGVMVVYLVAQYLFFMRSKQREETKKVYKNIRSNFTWKFIPLALTVIPIVFSVSLLLLSNLPRRVGRLSILNVFGLKGGNIISGGASAANSSSSTGVVQVLSIVFSIVLPLIILGLVPLFAYAEEENFRYGTEDYNVIETATNCVVFGLFHMIVGVPLGIALALSIGGLMFHLAYRFKYNSLEKELLKSSEERVYSDSSSLLTEERAVEEKVLVKIEDKVKLDKEKIKLREQAVYYSSALHSTYNYIIISLVLVLIVVSFIVK